MFYIYSLLYSIALIFLLPFEYLKRPRGLRSRWLREKFGFFGSRFKIQDSGSLWIHAVSVGEVISAVPLIKELKRRHPELNIILSTVTDTGQKVAHERVSDMAGVIYIPFDLVTVVNRALKHLKPSVFVIMETELWPNILRVFKRKEVPVLVLNGRISDNSFKGYRKIRFFMKHVLDCVDVLGMQEQIYKNRIEALGADEKKVRVLGNFKFDIEPSKNLPDWSGCMKGPIVLAGSTHEGEEELMLSVFGRLRKDFPDLNLILAPRHPERFGRAEELVKATGVSYVKRSDLVHGSRLMGHGGENNSAGYEQSAMSNRLPGIILILDTIGELGSAYGIADIAVMGGSFSDHGGHNPLEPAFWGKPVVCGTHMENFPFIQEFFIGRGAIRTGSEGLYEVLKELLRSPEKRKSMGEKAKSLYAEKAGSVRRAAEVLERYLKS